MSFELSVAGLASGFDWMSLVNQLTDVNRAPQRRWRMEQGAISQRAEALSTLMAELRTLSGKADALARSGLYSSRTVVSSDPAAAHATAQEGGASGSFSFDVTQFAASAVLRGNPDAGMSIDQTAAVTAGSSGFALPVTAGTFTVNGEQVTLGESDTIEDVMDKIRALSSINSNSNKTFYDPATDRITIESSSNDAIVLGSANDTSNFLQAARLSNNGSKQVTSGFNLGGLHLSNRIDQARFNLGLSSTMGTFEINGVAIDYSASDRIQDVLSRINDSSAGVTAGFDPINGQFHLTNKKTGDIGFSLKDLSGNFLAAARLFQADDSSVGSLNRGQDAEFSVNGGGIMTSQSNTLNMDAHGIQGLTVHLSPAAGAPSNFTLSVEPNTESVKTAVTDFVGQYNKVQGLIETFSAISTDAKGAVTAGILAGDGALSEIARKLRLEIMGDSAIGGALKRLDSLGYKSGGFSNALSLENPGALDSALANSLEQVRNLFAGDADGVGGLAVRLKSYLDRVTGENGALATRQERLSKQSSRIDQQIIDSEKRILSERDQMIASFVSMEKAQAQITQQLLFITQRFNLAA